MSSGEKKKYLLIPSVRRGNGTGHFRRALRIASGLTKAGHAVRICIDADGNTDSDNFTEDELYALIPEGLGSVELCGRALSGDEICVFDMKETPEAVFMHFCADSVCIGIDEGGSSRAFFDYLIDSLPNLEQIAPNIASPSFLELPSAGCSRRGLAGKSSDNRRVLLSFGGEDPAGLTGRLLKTLLEENLFSAEDITVVNGPLFGSREYPEGINVLDAPDRLSEMLSDYDLVFTLFGMTCFEALYCGTPVVLLNPGDYHRRLSRRAGIPEAGVGEPDVAGLKKLVGDRSLLDPAVQRYSGFELRSLARFISGLGVPKTGCAACGAAHPDYIWRDEERSYFRCGTCGMINMLYFGDSGIDYGTDYFFDDYEKQYGKTYLEDFETIKTAGLRRCRHIRRYVKAGGLLDIGCGYGPFLSAAAESGFQPTGIDISVNAAEWVGKNLGFNTAAVAVEDFTPELLGEQQYGTVTMWFVIEHLGELPPILGKINSMLKPGGVFAFSTPNYNGISRRRSQNGFLKASPSDHYTIWSPESAERILSGFGFKIRRIICPVIHPDRFLSDGVFDRMPAVFRGIFAAIIRFAGRIFRLGDTFEVYAVKEKDSYGTDWN